MAEAELIVDIATRVVRPFEDMYVMQPGEGYWLYDDYDGYNHVFLDFPGLDLAFDQPAPEDKEMRQRIVMSLAISEWLHNDKTGKEPSRELKDYVGKDFGRRIGRYVGAAKRLYFELPPGTIIIVPPKNWFEDVLIGEIVGKPRMLKRRGLYSGEPVPARKVVWLRRKQKSQFTQEVRDRFGTPNPLMTLDRSLRGEILKAGFDQYAYEGQFSARLNTAKDDFSTLDDFNIQTFVNYVTGVLIAYEQGRKQPLSMSDAIAVLRANPELAPDLALNINSIGFQRLFDSTVRPIAVAALMTIAFEAPAGAAPQNVTVTNSATTGNDPCKIEVDERVREALKLMKVEEWKRACESARDARQSTGLSTTMSVEKGKRKKP